MNLPKVNERKQQSNVNQSALKLEIFKTIKKFEAENHYKFESIEVDMVLLEMITRNHESYLKTAFGPNMIS